MIALLARRPRPARGRPRPREDATVRTLATALGGSFRRIQFTPDLLPADIIGTYI